MADIFISYAREDREVAARLAELLEERSGWSVFWDHEILPGAAFADVIAKELEEAKRVVVLWSSASIDSRWVRDEAQEGLKREKLTPARIADVEPPLGFRSLHTADLSDWNLEPEHPAFLDFAAALKGEPPAVRPPPPKRNRRILVWAGVGAVLTAAVAALVVVLPDDMFLNAEDFRPRTSEMPEGRQAFSTFRDCADCPEMVALPPGRFLMGATFFDRDSQSDERPRRPVEIRRAFALGVYEVTFDDWQACVVDGGCGGYRPDDENWGRGDRPVIYTSWGQAQSFVTWLSEKTGERYRLPSEAEWEYACRAGTRTQYAFGDSIGPEQASFGRNTGGTRPVGGYPANAWGLHDMHGSVWEWVEDVWNAGHRDRAADESARQEGPEPDNRTVKGGSWDDPARRVRCASRNHKDRDQRENEIGFRVARDL